MPIDSGITVISSVETKLTFLQYVRNSEGELIAPKLGNGGSGPGPQPGEEATKVFVFAC